MQRDDESLPLGDLVFPSVGSFAEYFHSFTSGEKQFPTSTFHVSFELQPKMRPRAVGFEQLQLPSVTSGIQDIVLVESSTDDQSGDAALELVDDAATQPSLINSYIFPPDDLRINDGDAYYLSWFVYRGPVFMGIGLVFPTLCSHMYALSTQHPLLHEAVLLFSAHFSELTAGKVHSDVHKRLMVLRPKLQEALVTGKLNDGHIIAVFLIAALYHYGGNMNAAVTHLHGLSVMLAYEQQRRLRAHGNPSPAPLVSFIHRQCIRFFNQLASASQKLLQIAPTVGTQNWDTRWTPNFIELAFVPAIESTYTVQDFQFAVLHFYHRTQKLRKSPYYNFTDETLISTEGNKLIAQIKNFQKVLSVQARGPTFWTREQPLDPNLDYFPGNDPPIMGLSEPVYAYLLLASYHLIISITVITEVSIGSSSPERLEAASALCRHYAVLQVAPPECFDLPILTSLFSAGLTFSPISHPDEYAWIHKRFDKLLWRYPNAKKVQRQLDEVWINEFGWNQMDMSWYADRRFGGTCDWTAKV